MGRWLILLALSSACTKRNPDACCTTEPDCEAKGLPVGSDCADDYTCIRNTCVPPTMCQASSDCEEEEQPLCNVETSTCVMCVVDGDCGVGICDPTNSLCRACAADADCASGYCDLDTGNCGENIVTWRYLPDACDAPAASALVTANQTIDTTMNASCSRIVPQQGGPDICVLHYTSISIPSGTSVRITGTRVVALVADQDVNIAGTVDIGSEAQVVSAIGPGGAFATSGTYPTTSAGAPDVESAGGGGAGFKTAGGHGGHLAPSGLAMTPVANGGPTVDVKALPILVGGPRADWRYNISDVRIPGGMGGGGMTVISCAGKISVAGAINASGAGGFGGTQDTKHPVTGEQYTGGGFGGGAGGQVLFQGLDIELTGTFLAAGGGGGTGKPDPGSGTAGGTAKLFFTCPPSASPTLPAGAGGSAGCGATPPGNGQPRANNTTNATSGGGGGSVGFFRVMTLNKAPVVNPAFAEPAFEPNEQIPRR